MRSSFSFETKARTLQSLAGEVSYFHVPEFTYFLVDEWESSRDELLDRIGALLGGREVIIRSSASDEDGALWGLAGQYDSVPQINPNERSSLIAGIETVIKSYDRNNDSGQGQDEVIVQAMVQNSVMSGVLFTHDLNTGAPYYVINYDDESGKTDTVTSGISDYANRTLFVHRGTEKAIKSPRFQALLRAVAELEDITGSQFLDVEFAVDAQLVPYLLQVRLITTQANWNRGIAHRVDLALDGVQRLLRTRLRRLPDVRGERSVLGQMPDWNPAEMIGRAPRRLASSLYRWVITDYAWRDARAEMGYSAPTGQPLMILLASQPYIDARLSFHSFLPQDLPATSGDKLVEAWLERLRQNPHLHDKVEFDVAITAYTFDFDQKVRQLVPSVLDADELERYKTSMAALTRSLVNGEQASISSALKRIENLERVQGARVGLSVEPSPSSIMVLLEQCVRLGTIPFAILARHAFIARSLLLSLVNIGVFSEDDAERFSNSIRTVASEIVLDMRRLAQGDLDRERFMARYGHLRPGTYDILSRRYDQSSDMFKGVQVQDYETETVDYSISNSQMDAIDQLIEGSELKGISAKSLMKYLRAAPAGREFAKFVFTQTLSDVLELIARFGEEIGLSREELSHIAVSDILKLGVESDSDDPEDRLRDLALAGAEDHATSLATRLPQLLYDEEGVHVVPFQVSHPNFITQGLIRAPCFWLQSDVSQPPSLEGKVVLIENADPGYDWIFAHNVGGLVTKFGGANSHMAIRCAEFGVPAAIGCGEQIFERIVALGGVEIDCGESHIRPVRLL